jgi:arsenate reductase-like glutaredoxin family protein
MTTRSLELIRKAGIEPTIIECLKTPPDRAKLVDLLQRMGMRPAMSRIAHSSRSATDLRPDPRT